jgi:hypothetical protein
MEPASEQLMRTLKQIRIRAPGIYKLPRRSLHESA